MRVKSTSQACRQIRLCAFRLCQPTFLRRYLVNRCLCRNLIQTLRSLYCDLVYFCFLKAHQFHFTGDFWGCSALEGRWEISLQVKAPCPPVKHEPEGLPTPNQNAWVWQPLGSSGWVPRMSGLQAAVWAGQSSAQPPGSPVAGRGQGSQHRSHPEGLSLRPQRLVLTHTLIPVSCVILVLGSSPMLILTTTLSYITSYYSNVITY